MSDTDRHDEPLDWPTLVAICSELADGAFLATVQADSRPHVAWVGIGYDEQRLWTATYAGSQKARNLGHHHEVALHWPERPDRLVFMRATARLVTAADETRRLWDARVLPYDQERFFGGPENPELRFVELIPYRASVHGGDPARPPRRWRADR